MTRDPGKLKFLSAVFFFPLRSLLGRAGIRYDLAAIANAYYRREFRTIPPVRKAVILPHCLIGEKCPARFSKQDGILCVKCKNCRCGEIRTLCEEQGWQFYISPSSGFTKRLVRRKGIRAAIGAACDFEIEKGIRSTPITLKGVRLKKDRVIPQLLLTARYDCITNDLDWERLAGIIRDGGGDGARDSES